MISSLREIFHFQTAREMRQVVTITGLLGTLVMTVSTIAAGIAVLASIGVGGVALSALLNAAFVPQLAAIARPAALAILGGFGISFVSLVGLTWIFHTERCAKRALLYYLTNMPGLGTLIRSGDIDLEPYVQLAWEHWQQNPDWKEGPPSVAEVTRFVVSELLHPSDCDASFESLDQRQPKNGKRRRSHVIRQ